MKVHVTGRRAGLYWFISIHPWHTVLSSGDVSSTVHEPQVETEHYRDSLPENEKAGKHREHRKEKLPKLYFI